MINTLRRQAFTGNWLSKLALWAVICSWAAVGVYGWTQATSGVLAAIAIALTLGAQVFAARAVKNAAHAETWSRRLLLLALGAACLMFTGWAGHQGLSIGENKRWAAYERYEAALSANAAIDAQIAALPPVPLSDEAGRPIGPARTRELGAQRSNEIARLTGRLVEAAPVDKPTMRMPEGLLWSLVGLIAALELLGFYAVSEHKAKAAANVRTAASELARKRWGTA